MIKIILLLICKHLTSHFYNILTTNEEPTLSLSQQNFYLKKNIYIEYNKINKNNRMIEYILIKSI
jgi:hypothetical protein